MNKRPHRLGLVVFAACLPLFACTLPAANPWWTSGGIEGFGGSGGSGGGGGGVDPLHQSCPSTSTATTLCGRCLAIECCQTAASCQGEVACQKFANCLAVCTDATCEQSCVGQYPAGIDAYGLHLACGSILCAADQSQCDPSTRTACEACYYAACSATYAQFLETPGAVALLACLGTCASGNTVCDQQCYALSPGTYARWQAFESCVSSSCQGTCL